MAEYKTSAVTREGNRRRNAKWRANNPEHVAQLDREKAMRHHYKHHDENKAKLRAKAKRAWDAMTPEQRRDRALRAVYKITLEEFNARLEAQGFRCAACGTDDPGKRGWQLDHCHREGHWRGILCHHCNTGLGLAKDNIETLQKWIEYLRR